MKTSLGVEEKIKQHYEKLGFPIIDYSVDGLIYAHTKAYKELIEIRKKQSNLYCFILDNREKIKPSVYSDVMQILYSSTEIPEEIALQELS